MYTVRRSDVTDARRGPLLAFKSAHIKTLHRTFLRLVRAEAQQMATAIDGGGG